MAESNKPVLKIDWATHEAAKYACENWHYSKCLPVGKLVKVGAWEDDKFIGVVLFSRGANNNMLKPFGLTQDQGCELARVALTNHKTPVSKIMMLSIKKLKKTQPSLRLIVSYADTAQNHNGAIYQATNWIYDHNVEMEKLMIDGAVCHAKSVYSKYGVNGVENLKKIGVNAQWVKTGTKYRYLMPLDDEMREKIEPLAKPYPKCVSSADIGTASDQFAGGGVIPTDTLQIQEAIT